YLVPSDEYHVGRFGFVIDEARHRLYAGPSSLIGWNRRGAKCLGNSPPLPSDGARQRMKTAARRASSSGTRAYDVISRAPTPGSARSAYRCVRLTHPFLRPQKSGGVHESSSHHCLPSG